MRYTELGRTGLKVSRIGFGGIPIRRAERAEGVAVIRAAFDRGVTFYDTAVAYGDSEEKIGEALAGHRSDVVIASKSMARDKATMAAHIDRSLQRLRTDYVDLYQMHNVCDDQLWQQVIGPDGALEAMREAKAAGKIRHIGITTHSRDTAMVAIPSGLFETLMAPFSYLEPEAGERLLPMCHDLGLGFICMKPLAGGELDAPGPAIKWVLGQGVTVVIPGIGSFAELDEDLSVADATWTLGEEELARVERCKASLDQVFCRACDYCQPCTSDIPISTVLRAVSLMRRMGPSTFAGRFDKMAAQVEECIECGDCEPRCPYHLPIPDLLRQRIGELRAGLDAAGLLS